MVPPLKVFIELASLLFFVVKEAPACYQFEGVGMSSWVFSVVFKVTLEDGGLTCLLERISSILKDQALF